MKYTDNHNAKHSDESRRNGRRFFGLFAALTVLALGWAHPELQAQTPAPAADAADTTAVAPAFPENAAMMQYGNRPKRYRLRTIDIHGVKYLDPNTLKSSAGLIEGDSIYLPSDFIPNAIQRLCRQSVFSDFKFFF